MPEPDPPIDEGIDGDPYSPGGLDPAGDVVSDMANTFRTYLAENIPGSDEDSHHQGGFDVHEGENYVRISITETPGGGVPFNSGQARLTPSAIATLNYLGPMLLTFSEQGHGIVVEGHTDNQPINTAAFPSNWSLSGARAMSVVEHLVINFGIEVQMIAGLGRGEYFPIGDNDTAEGRAQNRRVEIKIFTQEVTAGGAIGGWFTIPGTE
jgi:chemotaxis protein MotB